MNGFKAKAELEQEGLKLVRQMYKGCFPAGKLVRNHSYLWLYDVPAGKVLMFLKVRNGMFYFLVQGKILTLPRNWAVHYLEKIE